MKANFSFTRGGAKLLVALLTLLASVPTAMAAAPSYLPYPSADSVILNPYGENDEAAQLINVIQPFYRTASGRSLRMENQPGRGGGTAWGALAERAGDGYSLAVINLQSLILRSLEKRPIFRMNELSVSNIMAEAPLVLWVPQNSPFPNLQELLRSAKAYPNQLIISGVGSNTQTHLATLRLNFLAGIKTIYLPYVGSGTAMEAAKMVQAHAAWGLPMQEQGQRLGMRPLAVAAQNRLPGLPDLPTFEEAGIGLFESAHLGLALPASTPPGTRQAASAYFHNILAGQELRAGVSALGLAPLNLEFEEVDRLVQAESARLKTLLEQHTME